ncbi:MAG: DUF5063 domain-containing protein [Thiohalobacterales bacterium]|nr:DUF5063 domain-containing protein [Thiohalobacterales bacterium]
MAITSLAEALSEMAEVAEQYCSLIDRALQTPADTLEQLFLLMPRLHAAVTALNGYDVGDIPPHEVDMDERFEVYSHLRRLLGKRDSYWLEFDAAPEEMHMSGSLADDLTDIYFDLRYGLELMDDIRPQRAAQAFQSTYRLHWGQHLVDAERHLYALKVRDQLAGNRVGVD